MSNPTVLLETVFEVIMCSWFLSNTQSVYKFPLQTLRTCSEDVKFCTETHIRNISLPATKKYNITCWTLPLLLLIVRCFSSGSNLSPLDYFLWSHIKSLIFEIPVESEEELPAQVVAAADVGLQDIGDRVYHNMVCRYCLCWSGWLSHREPFL